MLGKKAEKAATIAVEGMTADANCFCSAVAYAGAGTSLSASSYPRADVRSHLPECLTA